MRLFFGIEIPERLQARIGKKVGAVRRRFPAARWVPARNYHLSLVFLGETQDSELERLRPALAAVCRRHRPFSLQVASPGVLPRQGPARVLVLDLHHDAALLQLQARIAESIAASLGVEISTRRFRPHLTIARCQMPWKHEPLEAWRNSFPPTTGDSFTVTRGALFQSFLGTGGARYKVLNAYSLGSTEE